MIFILFYFILISSLKKIMAYGLMKCQCVETQHQMSLHQSRRCNGNLWKTVEMNSRHFSCWSSPLKSRGLRWWAPDWKPQESFIAWLTEHCPAGLVSPRLLLLQNKRVSCLLLFVKFDLISRPDTRPALIFGETQSTERTILTEWSISVLHYVQLLN